MTPQTSPQIFKGRTLQEAKRAAEEALGKSATVVATREVRKPGLLGVWGNTSEYEVAATPAEPPQKAAPPPRPLPFAAGVYGEGEQEKPRVDEVASLRTELRREIRSLRGALQTRGSSPEMAEELAALRHALEELVPKTGGKRTERVSAFLRDRGVEGLAATALIRSMRNKELADSDMEEAYREAIPNLVQVAPWPLASRGKTVIALVGPTGVGKTTTAAKIAARACLELEKTITLVSCDGFRIGAIDQLKRYADLLKVRFVTANSRAALEHIVATANTDIVLVDTAGHGPIASEGPEAYLTHPRRDPTIDRHVLLCLPAALRATDANRIVRTYGAMLPTSLALTKLDETDAPTGILHGSMAAKTPVSLLCFGQRVPEDIAPATMGAVVDWLARPMARANTRTMEDAGRDQRAAGMRA